jgi:hypothetical protein
MVVRVELHEAYRILDVAAGADEDAVREARKTLAKVWHPDRHTNDPELASKAQAKLADINTAFETIRAAKFPSSVAVPGPPSKPTPAPATWTPRPPSPADSPIELVPRRRLRTWVVLLMVAAIGVGAYVAVMRIGGEKTIVSPSQPPTPPPGSPPPPSQPGPASPGASPAPAGATTFDLGATEDEVRAVQGEPTEVMRMLHIWQYGFASVTFEHGVVVGYWNTEGTLHVRLTPRDATAAARAKAAGSFARGASKDEVIALQGTPEFIDHVIDETWHYPGGSSVEFGRDGRVKSVNDFAGELRVSAER